MTAQNEKGRRPAGSFCVAIAWEGERRNHSVTADSGQLITVADYQRVRDALLAAAPELRICWISSVDGSALEVFGRAPKGTALLRKIPRRKAIPPVRWRTPWGGMYEFCVGDIDELAGAVAAGRTSS